MRIFHFYSQHDSIDCGPTCLRMIARFYGKKYSLQYLRNKCNISKNGVSMHSICDAANEIGLESTGIFIRFKGLNSISPCIIQWDNNHFVVCYSVKKKNNSFTNNKTTYVYIADPQRGKLKLPKEIFIKHWIQTNNPLEPKDTGKAITFSPTAKFYTINENISKRNIYYYIKYILPYKSKLIQILIGFILISFLQLIFPFLTQSVIDVGIKNNDINFIFLVLIAQICIFITQTALNIIRNWISLHINTRLNIAIISDFLLKLFRLPITFFTNRKIGDILQRVSDHSRIESLLTNTPIYTIFSICNFIVFAFVLFTYSKTILLIFLIGNILNILNIFYFLRYRRELDFRQFHQSAKNQSNLIQSIYGISDIKLSNNENQERLKWEKLQLNQFRISAKSLSISQIQAVTSAFFIQITNLTISYIAAKSVIDGDITLGMMFSISYIIGQLSNPLTQLFELIQSLQDTKISLERLNEIHSLKGESEDDYSYATETHLNSDIHINNLYFSYDMDTNTFALNNISTIIKHKKTTAIIGKSGCGKSSLLNIIAGLYHPQKGAIIIGENINLSNIKPSIWRKHIGCVLQDGFIFSNSILHNITMTEDKINKESFNKAINIACLSDLIESLPQKEYTIIGNEGYGLSQGQRQRILIARAIYKNPNILLLDEATNALDLELERFIMSNILREFSDKTIITVTHRLNSIKEFDNIIVMDNGQITEIGNHQSLMRRKGIYFNIYNAQYQSL